MKRRWAHVQPLLLLALCLGAEAQAQGLVNGDFSQGLTGWTVAQAGGDATPGSVSGADGAAGMVEGDSFLVSLSQSFVMPSNAVSLEFTIEALPGFEKPASWFGLFGPAGLPQAMTARLHDELVASLKDPEVRVKIDELAMTVIANTPEQFSIMLKGGIDQYGRLIKAAGIQPE